MRTWGRAPKNKNVDASSAIGEFEIGYSPIGDVQSEEYLWTKVETDASGQNDAVWLTTLAQVLQLGLNESPMFGDFGVPSQQSVVTQVLPDYYVTLTQQKFAPYFLALLVSRTSAFPTPTYQVNAAANPDATFLTPVPI